MNTNTQQLAQQFRSERRRRPYSASDVSNRYIVLEQGQRLAERLREHGGERALALLRSDVAPLVGVWGKGLEDFGQRHENVDAAEAGLLDAYAKVDAARAVEARGTEDDDEADVQHEAVVRAEARLRFRDLAFGEALKAARLPNLAFPRGYARAKENTRALVAAAQDYGIDFEVETGRHRAGIDVMSLARSQAAEADAEEAHWWIAAEAAELEALPKSSKRKDAELTREDLAKLFAERWTRRVPGAGS